MVNTSVNFTGCPPLPGILFTPIFLTFIYVTGFVMNSISLWILWFRVKQWNPAVILQFNLAIADAILTPAAPLIIVYSWTDRWTFGTFFCQVTAFLLGVHAYGSVYFLTLISSYRYFTVVHSDKRKALTTKLFITKLCIIIWGCLLLQGIPVFFLLQASEVYGVTRCLNLHQSDQAVSFFILNWVTLISCILIPFAITIACYSLLSRYILNVNPMTAATNVMVSKSLKTIFASLIIIIICFIPVHITKTTAVTITLFFPSMCSLLKKVEVAFYFTSLLFATNCCLDPIVYCYASDRFWQAFTGWCCVRRQ